MLYWPNNDYQSCIETCNKISDLSFPLVDGEKYFDIFALEGNSSESIFELQFDYDRYFTVNEYESDKNLYSLTSNNSRGKKESVVSEFLMELYGMSDLRQNNEEGDVTYHRTALSIWKYEGNSPYNEEDEYRFDRDFFHSDANWIFYRFPDIILMKAEAYAELDDLSNSLAQLNIVRDRAGLANLSTSIKRTLMAEILNERAREFVGEGKRWFDLVRICRRDINDRLPIISEAVISNVDPRSRSAVATRINDINSWFLPIFHDELLLNKKLTQNPFYR